MSDHPVEDRIDDLLRGLSGGPFGILDWIRNALHDVLHPMASVIDWAIRAATSLAQGAYNFAVGLYNDAVRYASTVYGWARDFATGLYNAATSLARSLVDGAVGYAQQLFNGAVGLARSLYNNVVGYAQQLFNGAVGLARQLVDGAIGLAQRLYNDAVGLARSLVDGAIGLAQRLYNDAVGLARSLVDGAIGLAQRLYNDAVGLARTLVDRAIQLAAAALQAFARDVIAPIERNVGHLLDEVFGWAKPLLRLVEAGAHWIEWVTVKAVPEIVGVFRHAISDDWLDPMRLASAAAGFQRDEGRQLAAAFLPGPR